MLFIPIGKSKWHRFEKNVFEYFIHPSNSLTVMPYLKILFDQRGYRNANSWLSYKMIKNIGFGSCLWKKNNTILPTIIENPSANCLIMKNEAFAPIVNVFKVKDGTVAIKKINASQFGLQAGIFTNSHELIMKAFDDLDVGGLVINDVPTFRVDNMPYGGVKDSGFGREGVKFAIDDMTEIKIMVINQNNVRK